MVLARRKAIPRKESAPLDFARREPDPGQGPKLAPINSVHAGPLRAPQPREREKTRGQRRKRFPMSPQKVHLVECVFCRVPFVHLHVGGTKRCSTLPYATLPRRTLPYTGLPFANLLPHLSSYACLDLLGESERADAFGAKPPDVDREPHSRRPRAGPHSPPLGEHNRPR